MPINSLPQELLNIPGVPDDGNLVAIIADTVSFAPQQTFAAPTTTLTRKPAQSAATVASNSITFDVQGQYTVTVAAGGFTRTILVFCFPSSILSVKLPYPRTNVDRIVLGQVVRGVPNIVTLVQGIEGNAQIPNPTFAHSAIGVTNWNSYC